MTKNEAMKRVNEELHANLLNDKNTQWSTVVPYAGDEGWWLNIPLSGFRQERHFLICSEKAKSFRHIRIKANTILSPATKFRCKDQMADVFISAKNPKRLVDTLPGGTKFSFDKYVFGEYNF
ncbi:MULTISPECIES: hypothetical protein [Oxalobacteraceae]|uniref:hypothetical protein n=1 Tax=Herminiimonas sp. Marseille-P9896 TaxID=2742211 RepID=UPI00158A90B7|nr:MULTISPECIES: hypothetical protein [Oxalobacteraceae]